MWSWTIRELERRAATPATSPGGRSTNRPTGLARPGRGGRRRSRRHGRGRLAGARRGGSSGRSQSGARLRAHAAASEEALVRPQTFTLTGGAEEDEGAFNRQDTPILDRDDLNFDSVLTPRAGRSSLLSLEDQGRSGWPRSGGLPGDLLVLVGVHLADLGPAPRTRSRASRSWGPASGTGRTRGLQKSTTTGTVASQRTSDFQLASVNSNTLPAICFASRRSKSKSKPQFIASHRRPSTGPTPRIGDIIS